MGAAWQAGVPVAWVPQAVVASVCNGVAGPQWSGVLSVGGFNLMAEEDSGHLFFMN